MPLRFVEVIDYTQYSFTNLFLIGAGHYLHLSLMYFNRSKMTHLVIVKCDFELNYFTYNNNNLFHIMTLVLVLTKHPHVSYIQYSFSSFTHINYIFLITDEISNELKHLNLSCCSVMLPDHFCFLSLTVMHCIVFLHGTQEENTRLLHRTHRGCVAI